MALLAKVVHSQYHFLREIALFIYLAAKIINNILGSNEAPENLKNPEDSEMTDDFFVPFYLFAAHLAGH